MNSAELSTNPFLYGSIWLRADFNLHTKADKEFSYKGKGNQFINQYVEKLKQANIGIGGIANHNKFDCNEFKALRKKSAKRKVSIYCPVWSCPAMTVQMVSICCFFRMPGSAMTMTI